MPVLPFGNLFWKFFAFFFLAQVTTVLGTGFAIWAMHHDQPPPPPPPHEQRFAPRPPGAFPPDGGLYDGREPSGPPGAPGVSSRPPDPQFGPPPRPHRIPWVPLVAGAFVSLVFAALLAAYVARPIRRLRLAMQAGAEGELHPGLSAEMDDRRDELADLGRDFDRMAQHIGQLMKAQQRLLHDVSHELRSPLARLSAIIGLARQQPEFLGECLNRLEHESTRMDALLSELLTLSRLESGMETRCDEPVDLGALLADVADDAAPECGQAGCRVELSAADGLLVSGDPQLLHRVFDNLLRNALRHAASGQWVGIEAERSGEGVVARVSDRGAGVARNEIERLFDPFYRSASAAGSGGHGLGLAIARRIVERHGGTIAAQNRPQGGLCVTVSLPRAPVGAIQGRAGNAANAPPASLKAP